MSGLERFDYCVSNPPYQEEKTARKGAISTTIDIFPYFYDLGIKISYKMSMIFPGGRWIQKSSKCVWIADLIYPTVNKIWWHPNGDEKISKNEKIFPNVRIMDGISIVYVDSESEKFELNGVSFNRPKKNEILPMHKELTSIAQKGVSFGEGTCKTKKASSDFFKIRSFWAERNPEKVSLIEDGDVFKKSVKAWLGNSTPGSGKKVVEYYMDYYSVDWTSARLKMFKKWKVVGSQGHVSKQPEVAKYHVVDNEHLVNETWMIFGNFDTEEEAINYQKYLSSKTGKTLLKASSGGKLGQWGAFMPDLDDYSSNNKNINWNKPLDPQLYKLFGLTDDEIKVVEES